MKLKALHEPSGPPLGFGVRQSSGALDGFVDAKAAEDCRTPRRCRAYGSTSAVHGLNARPKLELKALHEPSGPPPGFGVRQSSGALDGFVDAKAAEDCRTPKR